MPSKRNSTYEDRLRDITTELEDVIKQVKADTQLAYAGVEGFNASRLSKRLSKLTIAYDFLKKV
jgi:hypothetical protein